MSKPAKKPPERPAPGVQGPPEDEIVHIPKGQSRLRFIVVLGLMLFVLVIFTVGDQLVGTFGRRKTTEVYMTWTHPKAGVQRYGPSDFLEVRLSLDRFFVVTTGRGLGRGRDSEEEIAYHMITDRMAQEAGIEVSDAEISRAIREGEPGLVPSFITREQYLGQLQAVGVLPQDFETTLRRVMRVRRYEMMLALALGQPDPAALEKAWKEGHQQYTFDLVGLSAADVRAGAEAELPGADALRAWYEGLESADKARLFGASYTPVKSRAALLSWPIAGEVPAALLQRYPRPEQPPPEELARSYYDRFKTVRFARPAQSGDQPPGEGQDQQPAQAPEEPQVLAFDEVREQALSEALVHAALADLLKDLNTKLDAGEQVDLAAVAGELGLELTNDGESRTSAEWTELAQADVASAIDVTASGRFHRLPLVQAGRLVLVHTLERTPSEPPPFDAISALAAEKWVDERAEKLAVEKLESLRDGLRPPAGAQEPPAEPKPVDAESFARAVQEAGLTLVHQDWFEPARPAQDESSLSESERFLRASFFPGAELFALEEGGIAGPLSSFRDQRQWLVRSAGRRDPPELDIRPADYAFLSQQAQFQNAGEVLRELHSPERLQREFGLEFPWRTEAEGAAEEQGGAAAGEGDDA